MQVVIFCLFFQPPVFVNLPASSPTIPESETAKTLLYTVTATDSVGRW